MKDTNREQRRVVLVPVSAAQARRLGVQRQPLTGPLPVVTANAALCRTFGVEPGSEESDLAALQVASVRALSATGRRLVLAAQLPGSLLGGPAEQAEAANGAATVEQLEPGQVEAFFTDDDRVDVAAAARDAAGLGVDDAWERPAVQELLGEPLLWHGVGELAEWLDQHADGTG